MPKISVAGPGPYSALREMKERGLFEPVAPDARWGPLHMLSLDWSDVCDVVERQGIKALAEEEGINAPGRLEGLFKDVLSVLLLVSELEPGLRWVAAHVGPRDGADLLQFLEEIDAALAEEPVEKRRERLLYRKRDVIEALQDVHNQEVDDA